jgi:diacylglycerol O-acyltransferase
MAATRLSPLDASFLAVESPTAHMHVGWAARFAAPGGSRPRFDDIFDHIEGRLARGRRFRQRLAGVPLWLNAPEWIDDERFDASRHIVPSAATTLSEAVDDCMSLQLDRRRPLWELWIADGLADGSIGVVGKAHHCMVDGIAAVELASLLLDPTPETEPPAPDDWLPSPRPATLNRMAGAVLDQVRGDFQLLRVPARVAASPRHAFGAVTKGLGAVKATASMLRPARPNPAINAPISPLRHLATARRPLPDLKAIGASFGTTINDVVLAASTGGIRRLLEHRAERPEPLKAMVPVNVREPGDNGAAGNQISFMFVDLPCDEPDPVRRLQVIHGDTAERKSGGESRWVRDILGAVGYFPQPVRDAVSHVIASPLVFNLTVSNIPGPRGPMYVRGCRLVEAYPVVPIADRHALSIGVTTVGEGAYFGLYADPEALPEVDELGVGIGRATDELLALGLRSMEPRPRVPIPA